jgi:hypothetical protein
MSNQNFRLLTHLRELQSSPVGYAALHCHISMMPVSLRTRDNISQAINVLNELKRNSKMSQVFLLSNFEMVFVGFDILPGALRGAGSKIHKVFGYSEPRGKSPYGTSDFYTVIDMAANGKRLLEVVEASAGPESSHGSAAESCGKIIDGKLLSEIKTRVKSTDLSSIMLNQPIFAVDGGGKMAPMFHELYVSIRGLEDAFCPGISLTGSRWLFNDLTEDLDAAMLRRLSSMSELGRKRFSLNLNISALTTPGFRDFDAVLAPQQRANIIIEIHCNDLVANFGQYMKLAPILTGKGYCLCIDALDASLLPHLDLKGMHFRFAKVFWSEDAPQLAELLRGRVDHPANTDFPSYILARCDKAESVKFAKSVGIGLLQGKLIDHMARNNMPAVA